MAREHLKAFTGFLQADAYAGFERLCDPARKSGPFMPVACWTQARRKLHDVYQAAQARLRPRGAHDPELVQGPARHRAVAPH